MYHFRQVLCLMVLLGAASNLQAIVYTLQKGYGLKDVRTMVKAKHVLKDKVTVNGNEGSIDVYLSPMDFKGILSTLKPVVKDDLRKLGKGTLVIDVPGRDWTNRLLILNTGTKSKVVVFQMRLPKTNEDFKPSKAWPSEVPKPMDAVVDSVMALERSKSTFCQFSRDGQSGFFSGYALTLGNGGWTTVSTDNTSGSVFMNTSKNKLLILSTWRDDKRVYGSVYLRPVTKEE